MTSLAASTRHLPGRRDTGPVMVAAAAAHRSRFVNRATAGLPEWAMGLSILEDEIRICLSLLGVTGYHELDKSYIRPARQVVPPHVHSAFPHLNLARETY